MTCPACDHQNLSGAKFCIECGASLNEGCSNCGAALAPNAKFCHECGTPASSNAPVKEGAIATKQDARSYTPRHLADKILASRSAMEGEKKQVTVLFCDVAGSMDLAEALGPEAWHETLNEFFEVLTSAVHEFEGTVNQYTGDGIMALFGAPIAAEDHARRACMAALAIQEKLAHLRKRVETQHGEHFAARIGINSGEVVVGRIGDDLRMDYTAQGQVVGIAARLEALAPADGILLSDYTARQIEGFFDLTSQGNKTIKGLNKPLEVFHLGNAQSETTRFDISRRQGLTKFVGRKADMATLESALLQAQAGNGQIVGVVAEAGTGKSRLCYEFLETCRARGMTVLEGHALSHAKNIPFLPMMQVFKAYYGITDDDDNRTAREKITGRLVLLDEKFREHLPVQFEFFGVADPKAPPVQMAPEAKQRQLISVLRQIVQGADPEIGNIIAYIEDLHWLDEGSEIFLDEWVDALAGTNSFLLVNFRPEYRAEWMQKSYYRQIPLAPLSPDEVQEMLVALLGPEPSVAGLADIIFQRTGGNPFFCEEVVKSLQESGVLKGQLGRYVLADSAGELDIPVSVHSVLAARIDRLAEDEKTVLQTASVIGRVFPRALLAEVMDLPEPALNACLATLKTAEFIFQRSHGAHVEFIFKHALTQEVALNSQLKAKRQKAHAVVAQAIEKLNADNSVSVAPLIAHHWEQAGEPLTAAQWCLRAADHIIPTDIMQGMRLMQAALRLTEDLPQSADRNTCRLKALTALLLRGSWRINIGREALESCYREAQQLLTGNSDPDFAVMIKSGYGVSIGMSFGDIETMGRLIDECIEEYGESMSRELYCPIRGAAQGYAFFNRGLMKQSNEANLDCLEVVGSDFSIGQRIVGFSALAQSQSNEPLARGFMGDLHNAIADLINTYTKLKAMGHIEESLWAAANMATLSHASGSGLNATPDSASVIAEAIALAEERASDYTRLNLRLPANRLELAPDNALQLVDQCEALLEECRERHAARDQEAQALTYVSEAQLQAGRVSDAVKTAREAAGLARKQTARMYELQGLTALVRALLKQGNAADECRKALERADVLLEETSAKTLEPQVIELRARLAASQGDTATARKELEAAHKLYVEVGAEGHAERLVGVLAQ